MSRVPNYVPVPMPGGEWTVTDLNANPHHHFHGVSLVADKLASEDEARAWIAKAKGTDQ